MRRAFPTILLLLAAGCQSEAPAPQNKTDVAAAPAAPAPPAASGKVDRSRAGTPAPDTEFDDGEGDKVSLASFEGKPVLLNLWGTWCGPCVRELPTLDRLAAAQSGKLQMIAVSQLDTREKVDAFFAKAKIAALEPYLDADAALMGALKAEVLPTTILYDAKGREIWRVTGDLDWTGSQAAKLLAEAAPG
jgi:thiol-disulfide isomerase/thioredoxin